MASKRRQHRQEFKFRVALAAVREVNTVSEIASQYDVHPTLIRKWKQQLLQNSAQVFARSNGRELQEKTAKEYELYEQIGRQKMELEWLKKKLPASTSAKRQLIEPEHPDFSLRRQCELVGLNRSTFYHEPARESEFNLQLMRLIDAKYLERPFYGWRRMTNYLRREGHVVNHKRVRRLMRKMGIQAIYSKPRTSQPVAGHKIYLYLLRNLEITQVN